MKIISSLDPRDFQDISHTYTWRILTLNANNVDRSSELVEIALAPGRWADPTEDSTTAKVSNFVCLYVPPNLPTCDFERSNNSGEGAEGLIDELENAFRPIETSTSNYRSLARRSSGRNVIVYLMEGCAPSSIPHFIPPCEGMDPADRIVELRKLFPFTTKDSSGPTLRFPKFNHDEWMRGIKRLQQRDSAKANGRKDQEDAAREEASLSKNDFRHRTSQFISVAKRNAMMPKTTRARRYVSKGSLPSRSMAGWDPAKRVASCQGESSNSRMPENVVDARQNSLRESSEDSSTAESTVDQIRFQEDLGQRRHQNPCRKKSPASKLQKSEKSSERKTFDLGESMNRVRRSLISKKDSYHQRTTFDGNLNDLAEEQRDTSNVHHAITSVKGGERITGTDFARDGSSDNLENALDSNHDLPLRQKSPEMVRKRSKVHIDTVFPYSKAIPLKELGGAVRWRELFHAETDPLRSRTARKVEDPSRPATALEKLPRRKNSLSFLQKPGESVDENRRRIDEESSSKGSARKALWARELGSKSMSVQSRDVVSPKRGSDRSKKLSRKGSMDKSAANIKRDKRLKIVSKRFHGSRKL
ncbi:hypothetical protein KM043_017418 [Ampulex compressa]|nr:hypothetical protein KM043_017418 [Ampulex compressa]